MIHDLFWMFAQSFRQCWYSGMATAQLGSACGRTCTIAYSTVNNKDVVNKIWDYHPWEIERPVVQVATVFRSWGTISKFHRLNLDRESLRLGRWEIVSQIIGYKGLGQGWNLSKGTQSHSFILHTWSCAVWGREAGAIVKLGGECDTVSQFYLPNLDEAALKLGEVGHSIKLSSMKPGTV